LYAKCNFTYITVFVEIKLRYGQLELPYSCRYVNLPTKYKLCTYMVTIPLLNRWRSEAWKVIGLKNKECKMIGYLLSKYLQSFRRTVASNWVLELLNSAEIQRYV